MNNFEELEYQTFRRSDESHCIYIRQGRSTSAENLDVTGSGEPIGDLKIEGWYCASPDAGDVDALFAGFVNGIGVKGYADPESPRHDSRLRTPRR